MRKYRFLALKLFFENYFLDKQDTEDNYLKESFKATLRYSLLCYANNASTLNLSLLYAIGCQLLV